MSFAAPIVIALLVGIALSASGHVTTKRLHAQQQHAHVHIAHTTQTAFNCTSDDNDLSLLYRDNLEPDLQPWRNKGVNMSQLDVLIKKWPEKSILRLVMIYKNKMYFPLADHPDVRCPEPCDRNLNGLAYHFHTWSSKLQFPDVIMYVSVFDHAMCNKPEDCPFPIISQQKKNMARNWSLGADIMFPSFISPEQHKLQDYPWELKQNKAFWRGSLFCDAYTALHPYGKTQECGRKLIGMLSQQPNNSKLFDFAYTPEKTYTYMEALGQKVPIKPRVGTNYISRHKFLLHLDGFGAAFRLAKNMLINSVILKEESNNLEHYYRSLKPFVHYIPILRTSHDDVVQTINEYMQPSKEAELKQIVKNAQEFAMKYTCPSARVLYLRKMLIGYKALFPDMDQSLHDKWLPLVRSKLKYPLP